MDRVFLLSPANLGGPRARMLMRGRADFYLARRLRKAGGVPLGEVFSFVSALYFRGKLWRCCGRWSRTSAGGTAGARGS